MSDKDSKVINVDFQAGKENCPVPSRPKIFNNQTNPIKKKLFGFLHSELGKCKGEYKSITGFKPDDLI